MKGIGLVGAVAVTEEHGYAFENVAGTSAGATVAALIAAGYTAEQLKDILEHLDYQQFKDRGLLDRIPALGPVCSLVFEKGLYEGTFVEPWLRDLLAHAPQQPIRTFRDLRTADEDPRYRDTLQVIAADITRGKLLVLPRDIADYGLDPDALDVALAVRMSMSLPWFYEPVLLKDTTGQSCDIVDGGVLSNYPV